MRQLLGVCIPDSLKINVVFQWFEVKIGEGILDIIYRSRVSFAPKGNAGLVKPGV